MQSRQRITQRILGHSNPAASYRSYVAGCISKNGLPSRRHADGIKQAMLAQTVNWDEWFLVECCLCAYKCKFCHRWHLGNDLDKLRCLVDEQGYCEELHYTIRLRLSEVQR